MSEPEAPKTDEAAAKSKPSGGGNKLLLIIALGNFLGTFAVGGYLAYDKLIAGHASAQAAAKPDAHGAKPESGHGEAKAEEGHGEEKAEEEGHGEEKAEEGGHGEKKEGGHGEKKEGGHGEKKEGGHGDVDESISPPDGPGPIMALDPIVTNLAEPDSDRYLKVTAQLRVTSESAKGEVEASMVPIRSAILMYMSSLNMEDITGSEKRLKVQANVRRLANDAMPATRIKFVYFTEFVVQ
jgi:flagellar FliL protein